MKKPLVYHPPLFAIFPVLSFLAHNIRRATPNEALLPFVFSICLAAVLWLALGLIFRERVRTAMVVSLFLLLFFAYGHVAGALKDVAFLGVPARSDRLLLPVFLAIFAPLAYGISRMGEGAGKATRILNLVGAVLVVVPLISMYPAIARGRYPSNISSTKQNTVRPNLQPARRPPDIYYIILDAYARADVLRDLYGYDNSDFLGYLKRKGFYVAEKSRSNYAQTYLSLASSLNSSYLHDLQKKEGKKSDDRNILRDMIAHSAAAKFLKDRGYSFVVFSTGYGAAEVKDADLFMEPEYALSDFQVNFINTTPIPVFFTDFEREVRMMRLLYIFDTVPNMAKNDCPDFVFAHIIAPHPPFVFNEKGGLIDMDKTFDLPAGLTKSQTRTQKYYYFYTQQLIHTNNKAREMIDEIISNSSVPPIIILQGDHGPEANLDWNDIDKTDMRERMSIFNAYLLPGAGDKGLYDTITPVNTFRVIFNDYFGADYKLLEDRSYFSNLEFPLDFVDVTERLDKTGK